MSEMLSQARFERAAGFIRTHAREVERALFEFHFADGSPQAVWEALASYRNDDKGFGHALEPDFRLPDSSAVATTVAFQRLVETGATCDSQLVRGGIEYLQATCDPTHLGWPTTPPQVNDYPRAPWWDYHELEAQTYLREKWANPSAGIAGYFWAYRDLVDAELLQKVTARAVAVLERRADEIDGHDFLCYAHMAAHFPEPQRQRVVEILRRRAPEAVATRPSSGPATASGR